MSTVEIDTGTYIKRFEFWNPATWSIPKLYWDAWSQEQRLHAICHQLEKVIKYADYIGVNTDDIAARLKAIEDGQLDELITAKIEEWFEENEPEILVSINALNDALPIGEFGSDNTVKQAIDNANTSITNIEAVLPYDNFDSEDNTVYKSFTPESIENGSNDFSNDQKTPINSDTVQWDYKNNRYKTVANPIYSVVSNANSLINPLPILYMTRGYRNATNLDYGNDYTATNLNDDYTFWEPAYLHPNDNGRFDIDCTTLVILCAMGILYSSSTYTSGASNTGFSSFINMFEPPIKKYIEFEDSILGDTVAPEHRRILSAELAKMLYDRGMLTHLRGVSTVAGIITQCAPGDILFYSNTASHDPEYAWERIGHCSIVALETNDNLIVIDSSTGRGGVNNCVNYHVLTATEASQIKWKLTPPQQVLPTGLLNYTQIRSTIIAGSTGNLSMSSGGYIVVSNTENTNNTVNVTYTFPSPVNEITDSFTLGNNQNRILFIPPDVSVKISGSEKLALKNTYGVTNYISPDPYIP